jgi:uncharacterized membrane protein
MSVNAIVFWTLVGKLAVAAVIALIAWVLFRWVFYDA